MILEDSEFHMSFLEKSRNALREHQEIATAALHEAGIPISPNPYVHILVEIFLRIPLLTKLQTSWLLPLD